MNRNKQLLPAKGGKGMKACHHRGSPHWHIPLFTTLKEAGGGVSICRSHHLRMYTKLTVNDHRQNRTLQDQPPYYETMKIIMLVC